MKFKFFDLQGFNSTTGIWFILILKHFLKLYEIQMNIMWYQRHLAQFTLLISKNYLCVYHRWGLLYSQFSNFSHLHLNADFCCYNNFFILRFPIDQDRRHFFRKFGGAPWSSKLSRSNKKKNQWFLSTSVKVQILPLLAIKLWWKSSFVLIDRESQNEKNSCGEQSYQRWYENR